MLFETAEKSLNDAQTKKYVLDLVAKKLKKKYKDPRRCIKKDYPHLLNVNNLDAIIDSFCKFKTIESVTKLILPKEEEDIKKDLLNLFMKSKCFEECTKEWWETTLDYKDKQAIREIYEGKDGNPNYKKYLVDIVEGDGLKRIKVFKNMEDIDLDYAIADKNIAEEAFFNQDDVCKEMHTLATAEDSLKEMNAELEVLQSIDLTPTQEQIKNLRQYLKKQEKYLDMKELEEIEEIQSSKFIL